MTKPRKAMDDHITNEMHQQITLTLEWGRVWVGCAHGRPQQGAPVRICLDCFKTVVRIKAGGHND